MFKIAVRLLSNLDHLLGSNYPWQGAIGIVINPIAFVFFNRAIVS